MSFGTADRTQIFYIKETTENVTPTSPALQTARIKSSSLNRNSTKTRSEELESNRMVTQLFETQRSGEGDIVVEMSYSTWDDWFEANLRSAWVTTGSTVSSATDISITKTSGTPNTWTMGATTTDLSAQSWTKGQVLKVAGFSTAGTFYAEIKELTSATSIKIIPMKDVATEAAGDSVTLTPMEYVRNSNTKSTYTIQERFNDTTNPTYWNFTGAQISSMTMNIPATGAIELTFKLMSRGSGMIETQFSGSSDTAATTTTIMTSALSVKEVVYDEDPGGTKFQHVNLSLTHDNSQEAQHAVGSADAIGIAARKISFKISSEKYFEDMTEFTAFENNTAKSERYRLEDEAGNNYLLTIPKYNYESFNLDVTGENSDLFAKTESQVLKFGTETYHFQISRLDA